MKNDRIVSYGLLYRVATTLILVFLFVAPVTTQAQGVPFRNHAAPFDFTFGNHIDTHQQSMMRPDRDLRGFLYITFTGEVTAEGIRVARHCDESTLPDECVAGWRLRGKSGYATFVFHEMDHPIWLVGSRNDIPQPGAFSYFHWLGDPTHAADLENVTDPLLDGFFLELFAIRTFAFEHGGEQIVVTPGLDIAIHVNIVASFPESMASDVAH
jgi:hypothetical protein